MIEDREARKALQQCQTLTPSLLSGEQAIARLKEINVFVYAALGDSHAAQHYLELKAEREQTGLRV